MNIDQGRTVKEIMERLEGVYVNEKPYGKMKFRMHLTQTMSDTPIETLDLSLRSYNSLKRAGFNTIGEVAESVAAGKELKSIRNCGKKSVREIMERLFLFQYYSYKPERRDAYLKEVVAINKGGYDNV